MRNVTTIAGFVAAIAVVLVVAEASATPASDCVGQEATIVGSALIVGTQCDDVIVGSPEVDVIQALDGADRVCGLGDDDVLRGGPGNDFVDGGDGDDRIAGDRGVTAGDVSGPGGDDILPQFLLR